MRILIVDDDKLIRWVLKEICAQDGHDVCAFPDVERALRGPAAGSYDIIFADLETGVGDIRTTAAQLRVRQPGTPLVLLSSIQRAEIEPLLGSEVVYGIISKPFEASTVRSFIEKVRDRKREREAAGP